MKSIRNAPYKASSYKVDCCVMVLAFLTVSEVNAAGVTQAVEGAVARRAAKSAGAASAAAAERAAWQRLAREADATAIRNIQRQFGRHLPASAKTPPPARVMTREEFDHHLQRHFPDMPAEHRKSILGYQSGNSVYVNMNHQQFSVTMAHERLHQMTHPRFKETFGRGLNEGVTERFAKMTASDLHLADLGPVYAAEVRLAEALGARVGVDRLSKAYFKGEVRQLERFMDAELGKGSFARFTEATRQNNLGQAMNILSGR